MSQRLGGGSTTWPSLAASRKPCQRELATPDMELYAGTAEEIDLSQDAKDWGKRTDGERYLVKHNLASVAVSVGIVIQNLAGQIMKEIQTVEPRAYYGLQTALENIHTETYSSPIEQYIRDPAEKHVASDAISRDEGQHVECACLTYGMLGNKLPEDVAHGTVRTAEEVERGFICEALLNDFIGTNCELMTKYIEFVADRPLTAHGRSKRCGVCKPFGWMELISLKGKTNFSEKRLC